MIPCNKCKTLLKPYFLKNGMCNGCHNPHLVVTAIVNISLNQQHCDACKDSGELSNGDWCQECCEHVELDHDVCIDCGKDGIDWISRVFGHED